MEMKSEFKTKFPNIKFSTLIKMNMDLKKKGLTDKYSYYISPDNDFRYLWFGKEWLRYDSIKKMNNFVLHSKPNDS